MDPFIDPLFSRYYQKFPLMLIDIGASGGFKNNWEPANKYLQVIGFEPDDRSFVNLIKSKKTNSIRYMNVALYKEKTSLDFYFTRKQQLSSILQPNRKFLDSFPESERFDVLKKVKIKTDTLDSQLQKYNIKNVDFIKLDTQGSEFFILQGATEILRNAVFGLEVEIEFVQIYQDQPLFSNIDNLVKKLGFQLFDIRPCYWKRKAGKNCSKSKGQIVFADVIYLKSIEGLYMILNKIQDDDLKKSKILKALSICILYNHHDYALEILKAKGNIFNKKESKLLMKKIEGDLVLSSTLAKKIPNFRGRGRISNVFYVLWKILQPNYWKAIIYLKDGQRLEKY